MKLSKYSKDFLNFGAISLGISAFLGWFISTIETQEKVFYVSAMTILCLFWVWHIMWIFQDEEMDKTEAENEKLKKDLADSNKEVSSLNRENLELMEELDDLKG